MEVPVTVTRLQGKKIISKQSGDTSFFKLTEGRPTDFWTWYWKLEIIRGGNRI